VNVTVGNAQRSNLVSECALTQSGWEKRGMEKRRGRKIDWEEEDVQSVKCMGEDKTGGIGRSKETLNR